MHTMGIHALPSLPPHTAIMPGFWRLVYNRQEVCVQKLEYMYIGTNPCILRWVDLHVPSLSKSESNGYI